MARTLARNPIVLSNEIIRQACHPDQAKRDELLDAHDGIVDVQEIERGFDWELLRDGLLHSCVYTSNFCQQILRSLLEAGTLPRRLKKSFADTVAELMLKKDYSDLDGIAMWFYPGVNRLFLVLIGRLTAEEAFKDDIA